MTFPAPVSASLGVRCPQCGADIAPAAVSCPDCHALIHAGQLKSLADAARTAAARGDVSGQLEAWRVALTLLPPESAQFRTIRDRVQALSRSLSDPSPAPASQRARLARSSWSRWSALSGTSIVSTEANPSVVIVTPAIGWRA